MQIDADLLIDSFNQEALRFPYNNIIHYNLQECISCCEGMICNVDIPTNHTNAVFAILHARRTSGGSRQTISIFLLVILIIVFRLWHDSPQAEGICCLELHEDNLWGRRSYKKPVVWIKALLGIWRLLVITR